VVDLDDEEMVERAKVSLYEDVYTAIKYNEVGSWIYVEEANVELSESDIPEFLKEEFLFPEEDYRR
jgi:hypothetical protein